MAKPASATQASAEREPAAEREAERRERDQQRAQQHQERELLPAALGEPQARDHRAEADARAEHREPWCAAREHLGRKARQQLEERPGADREDRLQQQDRPDAGVGFGVAQALGDRRQHRAAGARQRQRRQAQRA